MFFRYVDRSAAKNDIRNALLDEALKHGEQLSRSRANNLADKFKRGDYDPDLERFIQYSDPTGETAAENVDAEREAVAA